MEAGVSQPSPDSSPAPRARRDSHLMRSVNTNLRKRCEAQQVDEPIAFFCECASHACYSPIWKSAAAFDVMTVEEPGWLLHERHEPSELWHRREALPTRTSLRAGAAVEGRHIDPQPPTFDKDEPAQPGHHRLTSLASFLPTRHGNRGGLKATHA